MSCMPHAFGAKEPTGAVLALSHWLPQSPQFALLLPTWLPQPYFATEPARAAYSHSASLGSRYSAAVWEDSHAR